MNKKGFTLIELLAVIVILVLLVSLATTSVTRLVKNSRDDLYDTQVLAIQAATETWGADNLYKLPEAGKCSYILLEDLKEYGLMDESVIDSRTNEEIPNDTVIKITSTLTKYNKLKYTYEVKPENIDGCQYVYAPALNQGALSE